jgi:hypothetical protein
MIKKLSLPFLAFLQTTGLVIYITLVTLFFTVLIPGEDSPNMGFYAPIIMLLVFVMSAVLSAVMILGRAGILFWEKRYKESFTLLAWTVGWGMLYLGAIVLIHLYL